MRDVSFKVTTKRTAVAEATLTAAPETLKAVRDGRIPKGDPLPVAKVAAVSAAKRTTEWIPYCHNIPIEFVGVEFSLEPTQIVVRVAVTSVAKTGVEMEAMTAAAAAALTLYDMLKMIDDDMEIVGVKLLEKRGGKSDLPSRSGWKAGVLTVSDRSARGEREDASGPVLVDAVRGLGAAEVHARIVADEAEAIQQTVREWSDSGVDVVLVTGGTGLGPSDLTPEALAPLFDRRLPGVEEALRAYGQDRLRTAMLSRSVAGVIGRTVVIAMAGSPMACRDGLEALFPPLLHAIEMLAGGDHP